MNRSTRPARRRSNSPCLIILSCAIAVGPHSGIAAGPSSTDYKSASEALRKRSEPLRAAYQSINWPADTAPAIGKLLEGNPHACVAFVRTALRFEPYAGVL